MSRRNLLLASCLVAAAWAMPAEAITIGFDDITFPGTNEPVPDGYDGFTWGNLSVVNGPQAASFYGAFGGNGYTNNIVSPPNAIYNGFGSTASITQGGVPFDLVSFDLGAAWRIGLQVTVTGLLAGQIVDQTTLSVDATGPATLETFGWSDIDQVEFSSTGGDYAGYALNGSQFVLDNLTVTPVGEPPSLVLLGTALVAGGAVRRRSRRRRQQAG